MDKSFLLPSFVHDGISCTNTNTSLCRINPLCALILPLLTFCNIVRLVHNLHNLTKGWYYGVWTEPDGTDWIYRRSKDLHLILGKHFCKRFGFLFHFAARRFIRQKILSKTRHWFISRSTPNIDGMIVFIDHQNIHNIRCDSHSFYYFAIMSCYLSDLFTIIAKGVVLDWNDETMPRWQTLKPRQYIYDIGSGTECASKYLNTLD